MTMLAWPTTNVNLDLEDQAQAQLVVKLLYQLQPLHLRLRPPHRHQLPRSRYGNGIILQ